MLLGLHASDIKAFTLTDVPQIKITVIWLVTTDTHMFWIAVIIKKKQFRLKGLKNKVNSGANMSDHASGTHI